MEADQYQREAVAFENLDTDGIRERATLVVDVAFTTLERVVHDAEDVDAVKRHVFYGADSPALWARQFPTPAPIRDSMLASTRRLHAVMGVATEAGELVEAVLRGGDEINLAEEIGDVLWYCAVLADDLGLTLGDVMAKNIAKLTTRYPGKRFTKHDALTRDLDAEREVLEQPSGFDEDPKPSRPGWEQRHG